MRYFKAISITNKPYIIFSLWAKTLQQLQAMNMHNSGIIIAENVIPLNQYGICPLKIENGQLVDRTESEMAVAKREYENEVKGFNLKKVRKELQELHFNLQFTKHLQEDTTLESNAYNQKLKEYNNLKIL